MTSFDDFQDDATKKVEALQQIADTVNRLDAILTDLKGTDNKLKAWYEQKKAVYEIKKILHEATRYDDYNQAEFETFLSEYNLFIKSNNYNK